MPYVMRGRTIFSGTAVLVLALLALAGCGGSSSNGIASKSAQQILNESKAAADAASSVHVYGSLNSNREPVSLNLNLASGKGGSGEVTFSGFKFKLILLGTTAYLGGSAQFYDHLSDAAGRLLAGKWLKVSVSSSEFAAFGQLANMTRLIDSTLASHGTLTKGATSTVNGQQAITITDTTKGGNLYVATSGKPYPLQITKTGSESGKITLDDWNKPVTISAPSQSIDLAELKAAAGR
jgi:hypothetical protein